MITYDQIGIAAFEWNSARRAELAILKRPCLSPVLPLEMPRDDDYDAELSCLVYNRRYSQMVRESVVPCQRCADLVAASDRRKAAMRALQGKFTSAHRKGVAAVDRSTSPPRLVLARVVAGPKC